MLASLLRPGRLQVSAQQPQPADIVQMAADERATLEKR
jgi:hypothetical protein